MFSDPTDFLAQTAEEKVALPLQLAAMGYDVWIGCTRGRPGTLGHMTIDKTDLVQKEKYWDFSFEEIGI